MWTLPGADSLIQWEREALGWRRIGTVCFEVGSKVTGIDGSAWRGEGFPDFKRWWHREGCRELNDRDDIPDRQQAEEFWKR